jgi:transcriptional regulator
MYIPTHFAVSDPAVLHRIIREHPLGMLVRQGTDSLDADHIPFEFNPATGPLGTLTAHVARANPLWQQCVTGSPVMVVFRGAEAFISPSWYPSKHEHHRHVPTWNYEVVHVHGRLRVIDDVTHVRGVVARLTREHETGLPQPWKMGDAPADYLDEQLRHILGIEVDITRIEAKRKLSQNRDDRDFASTVAGVEAQGNHTLAAAMRRLGR